VQLNKIIGLGQADMKEYLKIDKKFIRLCVYVVLSVFAVILFYEITADPKSFFDTIFSALRAVLKALAPLLYGAVIAYLLYKPSNMLEALLRKIPFLAKRGKFLRTLAVLIVNVAALGVVFLFFYALIPTLVSSISQIIARGNELITPLQQLADRLLANEYVGMALSYAGINVGDISQSGLILDLLSRGQLILQQFGAYLLGFILNTGTFLYNFVVGFVTAIYINLELLQIRTQLRRFFTALMPRVYPGLRRIGKMTNEMFFKYLIGKTLCSAILGAVCFVFCLIFKIQYAALISFIVALFNMIPLFGPFIGAVPAVIFSLLSGFNAALIIIIIIIGVQLLEQNILEPKIIGNIVHLNGFWIIVSIIVSEKIAGILGMVLAIPAFAVLRKLIAEWIDRRHQKEEVARLSEDEHIRQESLFDHADKGAEPPEIT